MASTYTTIQGDVWDMIAYKTLGDEKLMHQLMAANPEHRLIVFFSAGITLTIPDVDDQTDTTLLPPWKQ